MTENSLRGCNSSFTFRGTAIWRARFPHRFNPVSFEADQFRVGSSVGRAAPKGFGVGVGFEGRIAEFYGLVAQSVEQRPFKPLVPGSSPGQPTTFFFEGIFKEPCK